MALVAMPASAHAFRAPEVPPLVHLAAADASENNADASSGDEKTADADAERGHPLPRAKPAELLARAEANEEVRNPAGLMPAVAGDIAEATRDAVDHLFARRYQEALEAQRALSDPLAMKLVEFLYLRDAYSQAPYQRISAFLEVSPGWPSRELLRKRYELALLSQRAEAADVLAAFEDEEPITVPGRIAYASALLTTADYGPAAELIRDLWRRNDLTDGEERLIRRRFDNVLTEDDHRARMQLLLQTEKRVSALTLAKELGGDDGELAEARVKVLRGLKDAGKALEDLPKAMRDLPVYQLSKVQFMRRTGKELESARLMAGMPDDAGRNVDADVWALERRIAARELIEEGEYQAAYDALAGHAATKDIERLETEWHAGWVALNFLEKPDLAIDHFRTLKTIAGRPISIARAEYWLGRAYRAADQAETAQTHFHLAAVHGTTYYGQLAMLELDHEVAPPKKPIQAAAAARVMRESEPVRAARLLHQIGYDSLAYSLLEDLAEDTDDPLVAIGVAEIAHAAGRADMTVRIGKEGLYRGHATEAYAFTRQGLPSFRPVGPEIDPAVVYAIARQESLFNASAVSHAGAMGLMQLMPGTAKEMAGDYGLAYDEKRLTSDPAYNATMGSAYLAELIADFGTTYPLVFAAYNAGPSRVRQWLERFGDPRTGEVDAVDWVELIPFSETRNYVQRVVENLQVYRSALAGEPTLRIAQDIGLSSGTMVADKDDNPFDALVGAEDGAIKPPTGLGFAPSQAGSGGGSALGFGGGD